MMRQVKGIGDWLADILLIPGDREILPLGEVQNFQAFHDDLQDQLRAFARKARASEHWGRAPLLDLVHTEVARFLGWKIEARLIQSLIRGAETAPVGLQLDAFMSQLVRVTTQAQGEEGLRIGDTALRQRVVEVLLQRTLRDLRGKRPSPEFQTACVWPLAHYLDAAFVARQAEVVAAALEGSPLSSPPPELEGRFRLLMAREAGAGVERLFLLHLERWFWNQDISLPAIPESGAARLVRERQLQLFEKLDGDVWGLRWKR